MSVIIADEPFPDLERILVDYLSALAPAGDVTPSNLDTPFICVQRAGGGDDGLTDRARIEIACYAPSRRQSQALAESVRQYLLACDGNNLAGVHFDQVLTEAQAGRIPYANEDARRITATYRISLRRSR